MDKDEGGTPYQCWTSDYLASMGRIAGGGIDKLAPGADWNSSAMRISSAAADWVEYMVFYDIVYISRQTLFGYCAATLVRSLLSCDPIPCVEYVC